MAQPSNRYGKSLDAEALLNNYSGGPKPTKSSGISLSIPGWVKTVAITAIAITALLILVPHLSHTFAGLNGSLTNIHVSGPTFTFGSNFIGAGVCTLLGISNIMEGLRNRKLRKQIMDATELLNPVDASVEGDLAGAPGLDARLPVRERERPPESERSRDARAQETSALVSFLDKHDKTILNVIAPLMITTSLFVLVLVLAPGVASTLSHISHTALHAIGNTSGAWIAAGSALTLLDLYQKYNRRQLQKSLDQLLETVTRIAQDRKADLRRKALASPRGVLDGGRYTGGVATDTVRSRYTDL